MSAQLAASHSSDSVQIENLTVRYSDRAALSDLTLAIPPGISTAVIGPNGSGKSTLLGVIAGLVTPTSGTVTVDRSQVSLVLQSTDVDSTLPITVQETVRMARYPHRGMFGWFRASDHEAVARAMTRTGVDDLANRELKNLSGGQRQRVLVSQGLAQEAEILLLDEPVTGLDIVSRQVILAVVSEERAAGRSVIMTTHSLEEAATCDMVVLLAGRLIAAGTPSEVLIDEHLYTAFGDHIHRSSDGSLILEEPFHHHG